MYIFLYQFNFTKQFNNLFIVSVFIKKKVDDDFNI